MVINNTRLLQIVRFSDMTRWSAQGSAFRNMKSRFPLVPLSVVLRRIKEPITIEDGVLYKRITIRNNGRGVVQRDELYGSEIGTKRQFVAHAGQFIISRIDARNGAFGIVPEELEGAVVTNDFWLFEVQNALPEYLMLVLSSKRFQQYWQTQSSGTTNRQRVSENDFLHSKIALPSIDDQIEIVRNYKQTSTNALHITEEAARLESSIPEYLTKVLGIVETQPIMMGLFSTVMYSTVEKWGLDFLTSGRTIYDKKFPVKSIGSMCNSGSGGTPPRGIASYYLGNVPWVKTGEIQDKVIYDTEEKINVDAINHSSAKVYPKGSIIIAMYGQGLTRGRTAKLGIDAATNQACIVLYEIDTEKVLPDYLWYYLQGEYHRLRKLAYGNNQPNLSAKIINDYPVVIPPIDSDNENDITQTSIVKEISKRKERIQKLNQEAKNLAATAQRNFEEAIIDEA